MSEPHLETYTDLYGRQSLQPYASSEVQAKPPLYASVAAESEGHARKESMHIRQRSFHSLDN